MKPYILSCFALALLTAACSDSKHYTGQQDSNDNPDHTEVIQASERLPVNTSTKINTGNAQPADLVTFAQSLQGITYKYGSIDPNQGFDCSGFITYVFNHHGISVPRSSKDFTDVESEVDLRSSKAGDLILFTGTDSTVRVVGHMGIITQNDGSDISFIHSTSGKAYGVTITPLNPYYQGRFVKAIRVFKD